MTAPDLDAATAQQIETAKPDCSAAAAPPQASVVKRLLEGRGS